MKTLKYRSVLSTLMVATLSVFLFTSCEKESDGPSNTNQADRLEKFKRLRFTAQNAGNSGSYVGSNGNVTYVKTTGGGSTFTQTTGTTSNFTDPSSTGTSFSVSTSFGAGGGSVTLDGEQYDMDFGFCASADFLDAIPDNSDDSSSTDSDDSDVNLDLFIGISGDFDLGSSDEADAEDLGLDLILYTFSYNGATEIGDFDDFGEDELDDLAFVIAVTYDDSGSDVDAKFYFATEGSVNFAGTEVILNNVKMAVVDLDESELEDMLVDMRANLECVSFED